LVYGEPDFKDLLKYGSRGFVLRYYVYHDKIPIEGKNKYVVFFTLENERGYDVVDKILIANPGETVYWNNYNSVIMPTH
jgi:hypothetical protein